MTEMIDLRHQRWWNLINLADAADFLRICETENLTRAAALAKVSPSTLSRSLNRLEDELNVKLCTRDQKGIILTSAGRRFRDFASECLGRYNKLLTDLKVEENPVFGSIKIYCSVSASYIFIPRLLSELRFDHPGLEVSLETGDPANALELLKQDGIDFVIAALPEKLPDDITAVPLVSFPLVLIAPKSPLSKIPGFDGEHYDLAKTPFIMAEHGQLRFEVDKWFKAQQVKPNIYSEVAGHEAIVSLCALGFGLAVAPRLVVDLSPFKGDVKQLNAPTLPNFNLALCCLKKRSKELIIEAVNKVAAKTAPTFSADLLSRRLND